jgi:hypothetical protein
VISCPASSDNASGNRILLSCRLNLEFVIGHHCVLVGGRFVARKNRTDRGVFGVVEKDYKLVIREDDLIFSKDSLGRQDFAGIDRGTPTGRVLVIVVLT